MSDKIKEHEVEKEILRVGLDKRAAAAYRQMVDKIKAENPCVRLSPSAVVSFLVTDFYETYFEDDLEILVAQFFDSQSYYESEARRAKTVGDFDQVMAGALARIRKIKAKTRRKVKRMTKPKNKASDPAPHEEV